MVKNNSLKPKVNFFVTVKTYSQTFTFIGTKKDWKNYMIKKGNLKSASKIVFQYTCMVYKLRFLFNQKLQSYMIKSKL